MQYHVYLLINILLNIENAVNWSRRLWNCSILVQSCPGLTSINPRNLRTRESHVILVYCSLCEPGSYTKHQHICGWSGMAWGMLAVWHATLAKRFLPAHWAMAAKTLPHHAAANSLNTRTQCFNFLSNERLVSRVFANLRLSLFFFYRFARRRERYTSVPPILYLTWERGRTDQPKFSLLDLLKLPKPKHIHTAKSEYDVKGKGKSSLCYLLQDLRRYLL